MLERGYSTLGFKDIAMTMLLNKILDYTGLDTVKTRIQEPSD